MIEDNESKLQEKPSKIVINDVILKKVLYNLCSKNF